MVNTLMLIILRTYNRDLIIMLSFFVQENIIKKWFDKS